MLCQIVWNSSARKLLLQIHSFHSSLCPGKRQRQRQRQMEIPLRGFLVQLYSFFFLNEIGKFKSSEIHLLCVCSFLILFDHRTKLELTKAISILHFNNLGWIYYNIFCYQICYKNTECQTKGAATDPLRVVP